MRTRGIIIIVNYFILLTLIPEKFWGYKFKEIMLKTKYHSSVASQNGEIFSGISFTKIEIKSWNLKYHDMSPKKPLL